MKEAITKVLHPKTRKVLDILHGGNQKNDLFRFHKLAVRELGEEWRKKYPNCIFHTTWKRG